MLPALAGSILTTFCSPRLSKASIWLWRQLKRAVRANVNSMFRPTSSGWYTAPLSLPTDARSLWLRWTTAVGYRVGGFHSKRARLVGRLAQMAAVQILLGRQ